ncbi:DEAD/DEAH box helicase [Paracidovorax anthurii]|uniref:AAA domain-containing protein n=1 Tax=Paracidovorax anthurii TaxID=78229 RepID=A0A328Z9J0_9BURK|nr:ATP-binding protein [Paracidovorax anthurii]RAR79427.1 AAA domain-containing protein [Paracidovorax anthurii]
MKLSESPFLSSEVLTAGVGDGSAPASAWTAGASALLSAEADAWILTQGQNLAYLELTSGSKDLDQRATNPETRWVLQDARKGQVRIRYFTPQKTLALPGLDILIDTRAVDQMRQSRHIDSDDIAVAAAWLSEEFVCSDPLDGACMVFLAIYGSDRKGQVQLVGRRFALDLREDAQGALWFERLARRPRSVEQPFTLLLAQVRITDAAADVKPEGARQADTLRAAATTPGGYLDLWRLYGQREWDRTLRRGAQIQAVQYTGVVPVSAEGGGWILRGDPALLQAFWKRWQEETDGSELAEVGETPPDWSVERDLEAPVSRKRSPIKGTISLGQGELVLDTQGREPPFPGYVYLSLAGHRTQHLRRIRARQSIEGGYGVPGLSALLLDIPLPRVRASTQQPLTRHVRETFHQGRPTERQIEALDVALNTPDVALIIGPPGTGKTQVIAALERRLSELNEGQVIAQEVLISSFQHDAVENALGRSRVYGLPAIKVGGRRDHAGEDPLAVWIHEQEAAISGVLTELKQAHPHYHAFSDLQTLTRNLLMLGSPPERRAADLDALAGRLDEVEWHGQIRMTYEWRQRWSNLRAKGVGVEGGATVPAERRLELRRTVRALRTDAVSFMDDGPERASSLLNKASSYPGWLQSEELATLEEAELALEADEMLLQALESLQMRLLDRLMDERRSLAQRNRLPDELRDLLKELQAQLARAVVNSDWGLVAAIERYQEALEVQPRRVQQAVETYSSVVGATCQQAVSRQMALLKDGSEDAISGLRFGSVVVDEAARANPLDLFIPMALARRRVVLVGDPRQLPHLLDAEIEEEIRTERGDQVASATYQQSLFERLWRQFERRKSIDGINRVVMLDQQFRMHPRLGDFVSKHFYEKAGLGRVHSGRPASDFTLTLPDFGRAVAAWMDVPASEGSEGRPSAGSRTRVRDAEAKRVALLVKRLLQQLPEDASIGVITFYSGQRDAICKALSSGQQPVMKWVDGVWRPRESFAQLPNGGERFRVGTVDAFQGKEFDVVLLSTVRSNARQVEIPSPEAEAAERDRFELQASSRYGHLRTPNRLNVAMSRQRRMLIAVGDRAMFEDPIAESCVPEMHAFLAFCDEEARRG